MFLISLTLTEKSLNKYFVIFKKRSIFVLFLTKFSKFLFNILTSTEKKTKTHVVLRSNMYLM